MMPNNHAERLLIFQNFVPYLALIRVHKNTYMLINFQCLCPTYMIIWTSWLFGTLGSFHKLCLHFLTTYVPSLHFLCSKLHAFLITYPPLSANVICESSLISKMFFLDHFSLLFLSQKWLTFTPIPFCVSKLWLDFSYIVC